VGVARWRTLRQRVDCASAGPLRPSRNVRTGRLRSELDHAIGHQLWYGREPNLLLPEDVRSDADTTRPITSLEPYKLTCFLP
jgi:hypothetical protein